MTRAEFFLFLLACIAIGTGCRQEYFEPAKSLREYAFITNQKSNSVTVLDLRTFQVLRAIPAGENPTQILASRIRNEIYIVRGASKSISVLNAETLHLD